MELGGLLLLVWLYLAGAWLADRLMIPDFVKFSQEKKNWTPSAGFLFCILLTWPLVPIFAMLGSLVISARKG
jgi:hypothetical protein